MKKQFNVLIFLVFIFFEQVSALGFTIKKIGEKENIFPYILSENKSKQKIADNINTYLHVNYLELLPNTYKNTPFEVINPEGGIQRLYVYDYNIFQNDKFISIQMDMEGCGAYCEPFSVTHTFLLSSGQIVSIHSLFNKKGLNKINKLNNKNIVEKINHFIKEEIDSDQEELYTDCLKRDYLGKINAYTEFKIEKNMINLYHGRCSNHAMRAIDDLGEFENKYKYSQIKDLLSPMGKYILNIQTKKQPSINQKVGIYTGKIANKYPIELFIKEIYKDGSINAFYWYKKYKKLIELSGNYKNGKLELYSSIHDKKQKKWIRKEIFTGILENKKINGKWMNLETKKEHLLVMDLK